ncbi:MAG: hypothetical protein JWQ10_3827 [Herbaspirillum sp.]|nr:hypothetical protein [Herbaspirillum sp.]
MLISFIWTGHAQALPPQIDRPVVMMSKQKMAMTDCQPCASCYIGPPFPARKAGGGDPGSGAAPVTIRFVSQTDIGEYVSDSSEVPALALRILYCRWLN